MGVLFMSKELVSFFSAKRKEYKNFAVIFRSQATTGGWVVIKKPQGLMKRHIYSTATTTKCYR